MAESVTGDDVGKPVVYEDDTIGRVVAYEDGDAYVDPDPSLADVVRSKLGRDCPHDDAFPLQPALVRAVTDDEVVLESEL